MINGKSKDLTGDFKKILQKNINIETKKDIITVQNKQADEKKSIPELKKDMAKEEKK